MPTLYPLRFQPLFRRYLWGGRRLQQMLGKALGDEGDYAESWEIVDHGQDQSVVLSGPLRGHTLHELVSDHGSELLGKHYPQVRFPLLLKFLDAHRELSVQVHPNDDQAARLVPPDLGKTEAWVILAAEFDSRIYAGLKRGVDRTTLARELAHGTVERCLHQIQPKCGDCLLIPAGVVHALGAGLLVAEIQQASHTTFRLFDWHRVGPDGQPRQLQIQEGMNVIDFEHGPVFPQAPRTTSNPDRHRLATCEKFILDRWSTQQPQSIGGDGRCHLLAVIEGSARIAGDAAERPLHVGDTLLVPAGVGAVGCSPDPAVVLLDMYLP
jgi:mannose-6-phosphate isomerase